MLRSLNEKTKDDVEHIIRALSKSAFSSNQKQVITALMRKSVFPLTHKQAYQIVSKFLNNGTALTSVLEIINPFVLGFTCREACLILQYIKDEKIRLNALRLLSCTITDPQNRWMLFDSAFEELVDEGCVVDVRVLDDFYLKHLLHACWEFLEDVRPGEGQ